VKLTLVFFISIFSSGASAESLVTGNVTRVGDATHLEFQGRPTWNYNLRRGDGQLVLNLPPVTDATKAQLLSWKDSLIKKVTIQPGPDGGDEITFVLNGSETDAFDYLSDQPSRLILDFFKTKAAPLAKNKKAKKTVAQVRKPVVRKLAGELDLPAKKTDPVLGSNEDLSKQGVFDSADPEYSRFDMNDIDIKEEAIIASRGNIYLNYPMLEFEDTTLKAVQAAPPIYEVAPADNDENKKVRLLITLFNKKRVAVFLKTKDFFEKEYPTSKYNELIKYMEADIYYDFWKESESPVDLENALKRYQALIELYPQSPLAERTNLLIAYSYFERKDYFGTLKSLQRFIKNFPTSKSIQNAKMTLADALRGTRNYDDALRSLDAIEKDPTAGEFREIAAFKKGDVLYSKKDYPEAILAYRKTLQKYPAHLNRFPNIFFNLAEANFLTGNYKDSLTAHRKFISQFPKDAHGAYSMARIGELLEILGADRKKVDGAFLECIFRYQGSEGAGVSRVRIAGQRMKDMKEKEVETAVSEMKEFAEDSELPRAKDFVTIMLADGYHRRGQYDKALDLLLDFYKNEPSSDLSIFKKRIMSNITSQLQDLVKEHKFLELFKVYGQHAPVWLKGSDRIDIEYYLGEGFEQAGAYNEAADYYRKVLNRLYSIRGTQEEKERKVMEDLPSSDSVNVRLATMSLSGQDFSKAAFYLSSIKNPQKLSAEEQVERIEIASQVAQQKGQIDSAKKFLSDLIVNWKGQPALVSQPYVHLAELQLKTKQYSEAEASVQKVINMQTDTELVPKDTLIKALELRGDLLLKTNEQDKAVIAYKDLLERFEDSVPLDSVRFKMGKTLFEKGDLVDAEKAWSTLKEGTLWAQMAKEQLGNSKWKKQYKKYIQRIPAMSGVK